MRFLLAALIACSSCAVFAQPKNRAKPVVTPAAVTEQLVEYARIGKRGLKLLVVSKKTTDQKRPTVLVIHGGGWLKGDYTKFRAMAHELAARGFVAAALEYRLGGEAKFPAAVQDCVAAVRFLRANAKRFGIDPARIGAVGGSAGGHLAGLLATAADHKSFSGVGNHQKTSAAIRACAVLAGPWEIATGQVAERSLKDSKNSNAVQWIGGTVNEMRSAYELASPFAHISKSTCPTLFLTGEFDKPVRNANSRAKLRKLGVATQIRVYAAGKHGCWNRNRWFHPMIDDIEVFFAKHLGKPNDRATPVFPSAFGELRFDGNRIDLQLTKAPQNRQVTVPRLFNPVRKVFLKSNPSVSLKLRPLLKVWQIQVPRTVTKGDTLVIETVGRAVRPFVAPFAVQDQPGSVTLPAHIGIPTSKMLRYEPQPHKNTLGYWTNQEDSVTFRGYIEHAGEYEIAMWIGCGTGQGGSKVGVEVRTGSTTESATFTVPVTGGFQNIRELQPGLKFKLIKPGLLSVIVKPKSKANKAVMDLHKVVLRRVKG